MDTRLTIIVTASIIPTHPTIRFIKEVIESFKFLNTNNYNVVLAHDHNDSEPYLEYLKSLKEYVETLSNHDRFKIVVRPTFGCLTGNVRYGIEIGKVETKYILLVQHDFPFIRSVDIERVMDDMDQNSELKHIRFNKHTTQKIKWDARNDLFGKELVGENYTYTRTPCWSDNNHISPLSYYKDLVLKLCPDGSYMERTMHKRSEDEASHAIYGTYIFGKINESQYIKHRDGRCWGGVKIDRIK